MPEAMLRAYPAGNSRYDEMLAAPMQARPHWYALMKYLARSVPGEMRQREQRVQRQVRENGVTYNVYADPQGSDRPWELDLVPMIISAQEWAHIEAGVIQRAKLMNEILLDVYSQQKLLEEGHLPASLIHGHSGFLRPCHGIHHPGGVALHHYAVDLARSQDGRWWAVSDRTQAPSGAGYALENRVVIARAFPELFRDLKIQRLAGYFAAMRDALRDWGQTCVPYPGQTANKQDTPLIVLLTP